jgi:hypothetical protein
MSNPTDENHGSPGDGRADAANDVNATLMRLIVEGLSVEETELQSWREQVAALYRSASQGRRSG